MHSYTPGTAAQYTLRRFVLAWLVSVLGCGDPSAASQDTSQDTCQDASQVAGLDITYPGTGDGTGGGCAPAPAPPGCSAVAKVDGVFTGWTPGAACYEFVGAQPVAGKFGWFYIAAPGGKSIHFLNDWYLRDDEPICPAMYNLFQMSTGGGRQHWDIRVYGDAHVAILLNGEPYTGEGRGGYAFVATPKLAKLHTVFEFSIDGVDSGELAAFLHDPDQASLLKAGTFGSPRGCDDPAGALVAEPTIVLAYLAPAGLQAPHAAVGPVAVTFDKPKASAGDIVKVLGGGFGTTQGEVLVDGKPAKVLKWQADQVEFQVPLACGSEAKVQVVVASVSAKPLTLYVAVPSTVCVDGGPTGDTDSDATGGCSKDADCGTAGPCEIASCDPATHACTTLKVASGTPCNDGDACTTGDVCSEGNCVGGDPVSCEDDFQCLTDSCDSGVGCVHVPVDSTSVVCDDGNACTTQDHCSATGECFGAISVNCDDAQFCTSDACSPTQGCKFSATKQGLACDTDDFCFAPKGVCSGKGCVAAPNPDLGDGNDCTLDLCDGKDKTITHVPMPGSFCDDGDPGTKQDTCNAQGACVGKKSD